jgi:hypothetical protein
MTDRSKRKDCHSLSGFAMTDKTKMKDCHVASQLAMTAKNMDSSFRGNDRAVFGSAQ